MRTRRLLTLCLLAACAPGTMTAQDLRTGIAASPVVVAGRHVGVRLLGNDFILHKIAVLNPLRGAPGDTVTVVEWKDLTDHNRPTVADTRLYCLHAIQNPARLGLPAGTYYRMDGHAGTHPRLDAQALAEGREPLVPFVRLVLAADDMPLEELKVKLVETALGGRGPAATEAALMLSDRPSLLDRLDTLDLSGLLAKASAETDDIDRKLALATVCAERAMPTLIDALALTWASIDDERFNRAVGRFAHKLHGEDATEVLQAHWQRARTVKARGNVVVAIGATGTESALEALLRMRKLDANDRYVEAALRLHGAPRAVDAIQRRQ